MESAVIFNQNELRTLIADTVNACLADWQPEQPEPTKSDYITRNKVCDLLNISLPTVHSWIKQGKLKSYHIGGRTLFRESEVLEAVKPVNYSTK